jgi:hypothetical protein
MRRFFASALISLSTLVAWLPARGQEVTGLQLSHSTITVGDELTVEVAIRGLTGGNRCGLRVDFGSQESEEFRLGVDGQGSSTVVAKRRVKTLGPMVVKAYGKFLPRGLNSLAACGGREFSAKVDVVLVQAQSPNAQATRRNLDQELERMDQKVSALERRIGEPARVGTVDEGTQMIMPLQGSTGVAEPAPAPLRPPLNLPSAPPPTTGPEATSTAATGAARFLVVNDPLTGKVKAQLTVATPFVCVLMASELRKTYAERLRQSVRGLGVTDSEAMARDLASCQPIDHSPGMRFRTRVRLPNAGIEYDLLAFTRDVCQSESPDPSADTQLLERCAAIR